MCALLLYNLSTIGSAAAADALLAANIEPVLRQQLLEPGLTCLAATLTAAHLLRQADRRRRSRLGAGGRRNSTDEQRQEEPSMFAFSDRYVESISSRFRFPPIKPVPVLILAA